ncbi:MGMT family protein [Rhizobium sp. AQ_MP]|uniref:MGMT family protein n=1 Tax=Rhizobium sp. AQ_MP TaxID=2761536 RepID=UPI00163AE3D5|nr:MGMT family protein [Rhizobium sp. AQ_MP]MBC2775632.1 MGMT family protein [Rhizobium sp. AQ_MP]
MAKSEKPKKPTDWRKRFAAAKDPHVVMLSSPFAGVPAGAMMLISSPGEIARYVAAIPAGETRTIARLRSDLAKRAKADAMCPVTTAIYLRVVAEVALDELEAGKPMDEVVPFWRVIEPKDKLAGKLSCGPERIEHLRALETG